MLSFNLNLGPLPSYSIRFGYLWAVCNYVQSKVSNQHYFSRILYTKYVILIRLEIMLLIVIKDFFNYYLHSASNYYVDIALNLAGIIVSGRKLG